LIARPSLVAPAAAAGVLVAAVLLATGYNPLRLFTNWTSVDAVPFKVERQIEIASKWRPLKRGSASLLCGADGVHLLVKARLPLHADERPDARVKGRGSYPGFTAVSLGRARMAATTTFKIPSGIVEYGTVDTILTARLPRDAQRMLIAWLERGGSEAMSVGVADMAVQGLRPIADPGAAAAFLRACDAGRGRPSP
jgi:hypothetical protein